MKTSERHHLKTNDFAVWLGKTADALAQHRNAIMWVLVLVVAGTVAVAGYYGWQRRGESRAAVALAEAMAVEATPIVPGESTAVTPETATFGSEEEKRSAVIARLLTVADSFAGTEAARTARYEAASRLADAGRLEDAEAQFLAVSTEGPGIYGRMATLGLAEVRLRRGEHDAAIATYHSLVSSSGDELPLDALLVQLARAYLAAGQPSDARQAFARVVDEFPESLYAADARREMEALGAGTATPTS